MTSDPAVPAIRKQLTVAASIEHAFHVFTETMGTWWPKAHHIGASPLATCIVEPRVNGRWYERGEDGTECEWGKVLVWEPPRRLVLAWQLNAAFQYDPALITEVEIRFSELAPGSTQVDFEHRNLERFGATVEQVRTGMTEGWSGILESFVRVATVATPEPVIRDARG